MIIYYSVALHIKGVSKKGRAPLLPQLWYAMVCCVTPDCSIYCNMDCCIIIQSLIRQHCCHKVLCECICVSEFMCVSTKHVCKPLKRLNVCMRVQYVPACASVCARTHTTRACVFYSVMWQFTLGVLVWDDVSVCHKHVTKLVVFFLIPSSEPARRLFHTS